MEEDWMMKLELLKELKSKHGDLAAIRERLLDGNSILKDTEKLLVDFKVEVELLEMEKQKHTDIIRAINKDLEEVFCAKKTQKCDCFAFVRFAFGVRWFYIYVTQFYPIFVKLNCQSDRSCVRFILAF